MSLLYVFKNKNRRDRRSRAGNGDASGARVLSEEELLAMQREIAATTNEHEVVYRISS